MKMSLVVEDLRSDVISVGELGDDTVAEVAERIAELLGRSVPGRILDLLSDIAAEVSAELPDGRLEIRVAGDDVNLAYVEEEQIPVGGDAAGDGGGAGDPSARITLRLSEALKNRVEESAAREGVSVNTYIVRTLERGGVDEPEPERTCGQPPARLRLDLKGATDMDRTFETPGHVRLVVENAVGLVAITARATATTAVSLEPETPGADELVERATVECRNTGDRHLVVVKVPSVRGMRFMRRNAVTIRVDLPEGSDVTAVTATADIEVTGPVGAADVKTGSGDISTDDVGADVHAKTASGHVTVGNVGGDIRAHTASGDLRCSSVVGSAVFSTVSGDLELGAAGARVEVKATSGNVRLGELAHGAKIVNVSGDVRVLALGEGTLHVRSVSGDVSVGVARGVDLHVDVETMSGSVSSDIPLGDRPGPARHDARVELSVRSVSGNVQIAPAFEQVA